MMQVNYPMKPKNATSFMSQQPGSMGAPSVPVPGIPQQPLPTAPPPSDPFTDLDPINSQEKYADALLASGSDMSPAKGGIGEGLARLAQAVAGGYFKNKADTSLKTAKASNKAALKSAYEAGDAETLLTSDDPVGEKLGSAILEQHLKRKPGKYTHLQDGTVVWQADEGGPPTVVSRPNTGMPKGWRWNADQTGYEPIPDGPADPKVILRDAAARRAPPKPDETGKAPWDRKW